MYVSYPHFFIKKLMTNEQAVEKDLELSFRGAGGDEESQNLLIILQLRFFAALRMTAKKTFSKARQGENKRSLRGDEAVLLR